ncbi:MAG: hypothetical protein ACE5FK_05345 [Candidatus Methylomirabilia bacterium]
MYVLRGSFLALVAYLIVTTFPTPASAQSVGDRILLVERGFEIPGHPAPGNPAVSRSFPGGMTVTVTAIDATTGWFQVDDGAGTSAWITPRYIAQVVPAGPAPSGLCYRVGTWDLERFHSGKRRGLPENGRGGPTYLPRTARDLTAIAAAIRDAVAAKVLILNEINGEEREEDGEVQPRSAELDALVNELGPSFQYLITRSGGSQRVALLWDSRYARLNAAAEIAVPRIVVQGSDLFARNPLIGHFTFLHNGQPQNDLLIVGLHLAAGRHRTRNHDAAMTLLLRKLGEARTEGTVLPAGEFDILLGGNFNASNYDNQRERFFEELNSREWALLAGATYPATQLAGVPLSPKNEVDYLIVSRGTVQSGLLGEEITNAEAWVHQELANRDWKTFRRVFSRHFPVTACVGVTQDND